jgi:hypothetical protein
MLAGHVIFGGSVSLTVTVNVQLVVLPEASVATLVTVVVPLGKLVPDAGVVATVTPGQLSLATGAGNVTIAEQSRGCVFVTMFAGQVMPGGSVSLTVTVKLALPCFPVSSVAVQLTVVVPLGSTLPDEGVQLTVMMPQPLITDGAV